MRAAVRHAMTISRIPEHERRFLEASPELAAQVLPEPHELDEYETHLSGFYLAERGGVPSEMPLDKHRALDLYERLYCPVDAVWFVEALREMESEFFASRSLPETDQPEQPAAGG